MSRNKTFEPSADALHRPAMRTPRPWTPNPSPGRSGEFLVSSGEPEDSVPEPNASGERLAVGKQWVEQEQVQPDSCEGRGVGLSWDYVHSLGPVPVGIQLRALVEGLKALELFHAGARPGGSPAHGAVYPGNLMFRSDGAAFFVERRDHLHAAPAHYVAPEIRTGCARSVAADVFAVGVMALEALTGSSLSASELHDVHLEDIDGHPFWAQYASDPLVQVAVRAIVARPHARFAGAGEFAYALVRAGAGRIESVAALAEFLRTSLRQAADRATPVMGVEAETPCPGSVRAWAQPSEDELLSEEPTVLALGDDDVVEVAELNDEELISLLPHEPGSWRVVASPGTTVGSPVSPPHTASPPTILELPASSHVLDWTDFRHSEPGAATARNSSTLVSAPPKSEPGAAAMPVASGTGSRRLWSRVLALSVVVGTLVAVVAHLGAPRVQSVLSSSYAEVVMAVRSIAASASAPEPGASASQGEATHDTSPTPKAPAAALRPPEPLPTAAADQGDDLPSDEPFEPATQFGQRSPAPTAAAPAAAPPPRRTPSAGRRSAAQPAGQELDPALEKQIFGKRL